VTRITALKLQASGGHLKASTNRRNWTELTRFSFWRTYQQPQWSLADAYMDIVTQATNAVRRCLLQCITACPLVSSSKAKPGQFSSDSAVRPLTKNLLTKTQHRTFQNTTKVYNRCVLVKHVQFAINHSIQYVS